MPTTIPSAFRTLRTNLEITALQSSVVSTRQQTVRDAVARDLTVMDSFLAGSYQRSTMIAPLKDADIDVFVVLDASYFRHYDGGRNGGQAGLLDLLKRTLQRTYTRTPDISRNGQAVTVRFEDFVVDVVPTFNRQGGGYLIGNAIARTWISTDPKAHISIWSAANAHHNGNLVPVMKMIKAWNRANGNYLRSFHLEVLALNALTGVTISDDPSAVRFCFDKFRSLVTQTNTDPAGYGQDVGSYLDTVEKVREAANKVQLAYERALRAEERARLGQVNAAVDSWRQVFGGYFPAYG